MYQWDYYLQKAAPNFSGILSGLGGMVWHGLSSFFRDLYLFATTDKEQAQQRPTGAAYVYVPEIDTENFLEPCPYNPAILIPSQERSLVLYQLYEALVPYDDEQLMFGMQQYDYIHKGDNSKLLEVADFYGRRAEIEKSWELSKDFDTEFS